MKVTTSRFARGGIALAAAVLGISLIGATPAYAAGSAETPPSPGTVCWLNLADNSFQCFDDAAEFNSAVQEQTGASLQAGGTAPPQAQSLSVNPHAAATTYLLGKMFIDLNYGGALMNVTTPYSNLCATHAYVGNSMPAGWDNVVSSFVTYGTCKTSLSSAQNLGGTTTAPQVNVPWLGLMNDSTSSYRIAQ